ncbi:unnamed protein product [Pleuronectes platessa]|uniref:Uncharacterized protein n=1 Tax=Pleuronectes platessa TaxID=8262 RepID=A0A9N7YYL5_PLEPL|nr:unnamed protein product [Pleuronectes platessa]
MPNRCLSNSEQSHWNRKPLTGDSDTELFTGGPVTHPALTRQTDEMFTDQLCHGVSHSQDFNLPQLTSASSAGIITDKPDLFTPLLQITSDTVTNPATDRCWYEHQHLALCDAPVFGSMCLTSAFGPCALSICLTDLLGSGDTTEDPHDTEAALFVWAEHILVGCREGGKEQRSFPSCQDESFFYLGEH